ncbi:hypothetical protein Droror1_Dr00019755 [Drosera rotundifolia]
MEMLEFFDDAAAEIDDDEDECGYVQRLTGSFHLRLSLLGLASSQKQQPKDRRKTGMNRVRPDELRRTMTAEEQCGSRQSAGLNSVFGIR